MSGPGPQPPAELLEATLQAILFASGEPVVAAELAEAFEGWSAAEIADALERLGARHARRAEGLRVERVAGGFRLATDPRVGPWVRRFFRHQHRTRLSAAALETLAIVAYRQPITAPEIQAIRGVDPGAALRSLLDKRLIRIVGRKKVVGTPFLYGTTSRFLEHFGLDRLEDLPSLEELDELVGHLDALQDEALRRAETARMPAPEEDPEAAEPIGSDPR